MFEIILVRNFVLNLEQFKYVHSIELQLKSTSVLRTTFLHFPVLRGRISIATSMSASSWLSQLFYSLRIHVYLFICNECSSGEYR